MSHILKHSFPGAKRKFRALHGTTTPLPIIKYGGLIIEYRDPCDNGIPESICMPLDVLLY